jgi:hypothetical protein
MFVTPDNYEKLTKIQKSFIAFLETNKGQSNHIIIRENSFRNSYPPFEIHLLHQTDRKCKTSGKLNVLPDYVQSADAKVRVYYDHDTCPENLLSALTELIRHYSGKCGSNENLVRDQPNGALAIQIGTNGRLDWSGLIHNGRVVNFGQDLLPNFEELNTEISRNVSTISVWINNRNSGKQEVSLEDFNFDNKTKLNIQLVLNDGELMLITDSNPGIRLRFDTRNLAQHVLTQRITSALASIIGHLPPSSKFEIRDRNKDMIIKQNSEDINLVYDNENRKFKRVEHE